MKQFLFASFYVLLSIVFLPFLSAYDVTVVGTVGHADGLGRISVGFIDLLKDDIKINCRSLHTNLRDISEEVKEVLNNPDKSSGRVSFFTYPIWNVFSPLAYANVLDSDIKIAYSMLESTTIPPEWTLILNSHFDVVVVPDHFLVEVYKSAGVTIPIFELPLGMYLDEYLQREKRERPSSPFIFGTTVSLDERKNTSLLIKSFAEVFGESKDVILKLNGRQGNIDVYKKLIESLEVSNIQLTHDVLGKEQYVDFIDSFDCFINISKGEGFSLCPREALALGIPCILTNNSSQITICNSGLVCPVPSNILEPTNYWGIFGGQQVGDFSNCTKEDVKAALIDVYTNYPLYHDKAQSGPKWVSQYAWANLKKKYLNLVKPKAVRLGSENKITDNYLQTDSLDLYHKYLKAFINHK